MRFSTCIILKGLEKVSDLRLPYHTAFKKAKYIDENGKFNWANWS